MEATFINSVRELWNQSEFYQLLSHICVDFGQHIGIDSSAAVCNSLPKVMRTSDLNSVQESPKCKVQGVKVR
jgi:hypothetical protein